MLEARKASVWRRRYDLVADGRSVATWDGALWRGGGAFVLDGRPYQVGSNAWGTRFTLLDANEVTVASADRVGRKRWTVEAEGRTYEVRRVSLWSDEQELYLDGNRVGFVRRTSRWRGDAAADLPGLPLPAQIFVLAVVLTMWEQRAAAAGATSG